MAMNRVQVQPGLSLPPFLAGYGSEGPCERALEASRWPDCCVGPRCAGKRCSRLHRRLRPGADVDSDGLGAFRVLEVEHAQTVIEGHGRNRCEQDNARWVTVVLSHLKRWLDGAYHAFKLARYAHRSWPRPDGGATGASI